MTETSEQSRQSSAGHINSLEQLPVPAALTGADGILLQVNDSYCLALGQPRHAFVGNSVFDMVDEETAHEVRTIYASLSPQTPTRIAPARLQTFAETARRRIWERTGLFDEHGKLSTVVATFWDVTEEHRYNDTLEDLIRITNNRALDVEAVLRGILGIGYAYFAMPDAVITRRTAEGVLAEVQIIEHDGGIPADQIPPLDQILPLEMSYTAITHAEQRIVAIADIETTAHVESAFYRRQPRRSFLSTEIHVDGSVYGALSFASSRPRSRPYGNDEIQLMRILAQWLSYALSRRDRFEQLRASEERFRFIYQNSPIMMHTLDRSRRIADVNRLWLKTLGYRRDEVIGADILAFTAPGSHAAVLSEFDAVNTPARVDAALNMQRKDGGLVEVEVSSLLDEEGGGMHTVINDVTERNRSQRSLARLNEGLGRTHASLKRFHAIAAHDLQETLRKINLFAEVLGEALSGVDEPEAREPFAVIKRSCARLSKLVGDLLAFTKETQRRYTRWLVDLERLVDDTIGDLAPMIAQTNTRLTVEKLPPVTGDPEALRQLFRNLLTNALTYQREGVQPTIRILATAMSDGSLAIAVRDNGIGLPEGARDRIFEPFARLQPHSYSGSGIGLAVAKSIAEGHKWSIDAGPNPDGEGAEFIVTVPPCDAMRQTASQP